MSEHSSRMYHFHVILFGPYTWTWEQSAEALQALPRMIFEPDGSWIWSGGVEQNRWQIDGHLFDFSGHLHRVELHGFCPADQFDRLLRCFGWPEVTFSYEMIREGITLEEESFRAAMTSAFVTDPKSAI